jgi:cob(I)alamin adenosyltransferase
MDGFVHVYTGDGKGKTTAALGLALRAAGAGWRVFIGQFLKGADCSETAALERHADLITIRRFGNSAFVGPVPERDDVARAVCGLAESCEALMSGRYPLVILDEANVAVALRLLSVEDLAALMDVRPPAVELVITGRWAHPQILNRADLITEMRQVKHYHEQGVLARAGIDC